MSSLTYLFQPTSLSDCPSLWPPPLPPSLQWPLLHKGSVFRSRMEQVLGLKIGTPFPGLVFYRCCLMEFSLQFFLEAFRFLLTNEKTGNQKRWETCLRWTQEVCGWASPQTQAYLSVTACCLHSVSTETHRCLAILGPEVNLSMVRKWNRDGLLRANRPRSNLS